MDRERDELERALRRMHAAYESLRDDLLQLGAQVAELQEVLVERGTLEEQELEGRHAEAVERTRAADEGNPWRVELGDPTVDKYKVESPPTPCAELFPICKARCCHLTPTLSTQDLDEGVVRWDYVRPYRIRKGRDGRCIHNDAETGGCGVYEHRPAPCRSYDCRHDERIWIDYERRIPAPISAASTRTAVPDVSQADLRARARDRQLSQAIEEISLRSKK